MSSAVGATRRHSPAARPTVGIVLPRGEAIRNLLYSGALAELRHVCRLVVVSVRPSDRVFHDLAEVADRLEPLDEIRERWPVRFAREVLDVAHGRWLGSEAARERWRIRSLEARGAIAGRAKLAGKRLLARPFATARGVRRLSGLERAASRHLRTSEPYTALWRDERPALVFNASHVHSRNAIQAVQAAQWLGVPAATFVFSWDNLTSQGRILPPYDAYLVWSERLGRQLLDLYPPIDPETVYVTGSPQFDCHLDRSLFVDRDSFCHQIGADPGRPIVLYSTGMPNHMPNEPSVVADLADRLAALGDLGPPQLVVRIYPKDTSGRFESLRERRGDILFPRVPWEPRWFTPLPEDAPLYVNSLRHAAVGVNIASTVSLELFLHGKPVVNIGYDLGGCDAYHTRIERYYRFEHYRPLVELGAVEVAASGDEALGAIRRALRAPAERSAARQAALEHVFGAVPDGRATERLVATLAALAEVEPPLPGGEET